MGYDEGNRFPRGPDIASGISGISRWVVPLVVIILIVAVIGFGALVQVPPGTRGVITTFGKVENRILDEGLNFKIPLVQTVIFMDVQIQKAESTESSATQDLQEVSTTIAVNFRLNPSKVNTVYQELRRDYVDRVIKPNIEEGLKATTANFRAEELITKRADVKSSFDTILAERLEVFNIEVVSVSLTDFQFSRSFNDAIEAKVTAEQEALQAENTLEKIKFEAQQKIIQAEAEKNATIARAEGDAQAVIIEADATAKAIEIITGQMTPEYAQYLWLLQWDGKLPAVLGEAAQGIILDISSLTEPE